MKKRMNITIMRTTDFLIECGIPETFNKKVRKYAPAALIKDDEGNYKMEDGYYVMRVFGRTDFVKVMIQKEGFGKVIKKINEVTN